MEDFITVQNFAMSFGPRTVIKDLNFTIKKGQIFGLLGSNGSGKTTTIRTLLGFYKPTRGQLLINGQPYSPENTHLTVGYLPEERGLYRKENVIDIMTYFGELKGLKNPKSWSLDYLEKVNLKDQSTTKLEKLSSGQQQKVQLGITIMQDPELLILDEPTKGFDPVNRKLLMDIIENLHRQGTTIILITHYMDEVERLCDHILLLKDGVARASGTIPDVKQQFNNQSLDEIFINIYGANHV